MDMWVQKGFEGWYFKHQKGDDMVAFIPGRAESGAFVQMISQEGARQFAIEDFSVRHGVIRADKCWFTRHGCRIELPGVRGKIDYGPFTPLAGDIMGPFRFFPMQCRHGVLSMSHSLRGSVAIDGQLHCFDGGVGYTEKDSGTSFPRSYLWMQCNDFPRHICLSQGSLLLELDMLPSFGGHALRAPQQGRMSGTIRESCNAHLRARLWKKGTRIFDLESDHAAYEFVPRHEA